MKSIRLFLLVLCAACGLTAASAVAATVNPPQDAGELILGFRATGGTGALVNLEVDVGLASDYQNGSGAKRQVAALSGADLTAIYGRWNIRSDLQWGIVASAYDDSFSSIIYGSRKETEPGTKSSPYPGAGGGVLDTAVGTISSATGWLVGKTSTANSNFAASVNTSDQGSWSSLENTQPGLSFNFFDTSLFENSTMVSGTGYVVSDLWCFVSTGEVTYVGSFALDANGALWFSKNPADFSSPTGPSIKTQPTAQSVSAGQDVTFTVEAAGTAPFTYKWQRNNVDIPNGNTATLTLSAVTIAQAGDYTVIISNSVGPDVTSSVATLTVGQAAATITWPAPAAITYGTPLSATQLNATSPIAGTYSYTPVLGTVLGAGANQTLSVTFTPTDTTSYNSATKTVQLTVNQAPLTVTADDVTRVYNTADPVFTFNYAGFVNNDSAVTANITAPTLATDATLASDAGQYAIIVTGGSAVNYTLSPVAGKLTITPADPAIVLGNLIAAYDGQPKPVSVTTTPASLPFVVTYNGSAIVPSGVGTYAVQATVNTVNYQGTATGQLVIGSATATVTLGSLTAVYDGTPKAASVTTNPGGLNVVVTYNGNASVPVIVGSYHVVALVNDANYRGSQEGTLVISQAMPAITWPTPGDIAYGTLLSEIQLNASVGADIPGAFAYTSLQGVAQIGTKLPAGTQTLSVTFTPTDGANYATATATVSLNVAKATPVITWPTPAAIDFGTVLSATQLNATVTSGIPGSFTYTPPAGTGLNAGDASQTLSVSFTPTDTVDYNPATKTTTIKVNKAAQTITFDPIATATLNTPVTLVATATSGLPVTFTVVSGPATITGNDLTITGETEVTVAASQPGNENYAAANPVEQPVTVGKLAASISFGALVATYDGTPKAATTTTSPSGLAVTLTYESVTYPKSITPPTNAGEYQVSASITDADHQGFASGKFVINKAVPTCTWTKPAAITYGTALGSTQLNATATGISGALDGVFTYTPPAGTVFAVSEQEYALSATFVPTDTVNYASGAASTTIKVNPATLTVTAKDFSRAYGAANPTFTLTYSGFMNSDTLTSLTAATPPTLTPPTAATTATLASPVGPYPITLTGGSAANYTFALVPGTLTVTKANASITLGALAQTYDGTPRTITTATSPSGLAVSVTYDGGSSLPVSAGSHPVVATIVDPNYQGTATNALVITKAAPALAWAAPASITYGATLSATQLNATAGIAGSFNYSPALGTVLNAGANQTLSVTFTPSDSANYTAATTTVALTVTKATPTLAWAAPAAITYGTALGASQLNAAANVPGTFTYSPAAGSVPAVGTQTLSVAFTPTDVVNYSTATTTTSLTVSKATPMLTWNASTAITYGTALSTTQLNATANIPGTFAYTPASGTRLNAGANQTLSLTFTPTDAANQSPVTITVSLTVNPAPLTVTAQNVARAYGADNPALTFVYAGFVNGETKSVLNSEPVATTTATTASAPGTYPITLAGGSAANYALTLVNGTLTVTPQNYAGTYFGAFTSGGTWALTVRSDGTATYIAYLADRHSAIVVSLTVDSTGAFTVTGSELVAAADVGDIRRAAEADTRSAAATTGYTLTGTINASGVTGQITGLGESFTGAVDATTGPAAGYAGYYTAGGLSTAGGTTYSVVGASGTAVTIIVAPGLVDGGVGTVDATGQSSVTTTAGTQLALQLDAAAQSVAVTATPSGQAPISFAGIATGTASTSRLINLSVRARSATGDDTLIVGYVVGGSGAKPLLVRAVGPSLSQFGLTGTLIDPKISVLSGGAFPATIGANDDWSDSALVALSARLGAFALTPGSLDASLSLPTQSVPGSYTALVTDRSGSTGLVLAEVYDADAGAGTARLLNLSARARVGTGDNVMIAGFVVVGNAPVKVLLRGVGPTLSSQNVASPVVDPRIDLIKTVNGVNTLVASNDNWGGTAALSAAFTTTGAFSLPPASKDAALLVTLPAGVYNVTLSGVGGATGVGLVEIYEVP